MTWLDELRKEEIVDRVQRDPRSKPGTRLGWPENDVQDQVLCWGQADFDAPIGNLTGADRALLYALYNQKRHLTDLRGLLATLFEATERAGTLTVIDLGCGPFTAGLAVAAELGADRPFHYFGIDRSVEMQKLGHTFADAARARGGLHPDTTVTFGSDLDKQEFGEERWDATLVIASYLLASPSLVPADFCASVVAAVERRGPGLAAFLYLNSPSKKPNVKWPDVSAALVSAGFEVLLDETAHVRCALLVRPPRSSRPIPGLS